MDQIERTSSLNIFLTVMGDSALEKARLVDKKIAGGKAGKLAGMIVAVKDILAIRDVRTTCGSKILETFHSPYSATVVERLEKEDALIVGKTNMDEFGMGSSNENSAFGPVKNPFDPERIPGGSSGGSAAAVASECAMTALGSDTGGSVRQPAAHCGVLGLRPTYGRVSRYGLIAFASSLDQVGIFSQNAEDCASVLEAISGFDERDSTSVNCEVPSFSSDLGMDVRGLRVGLPSEYFQSGLQADIQVKINELCEMLEQNGASIQKISLPLTDYGIAAYYLICTAEASSNLARFDGVRYGSRIDTKEDLKHMYCETRSRGFGEEVKRRIMLGTYVLSAGYYDAYYRKAQKVRTLIRKEYDEAFGRCDMILGPTTPTTAFRLGEKINDPMEMYLSDIYTVTAPLAGLPAISIPAGKDTNGMPIGIQLTAPAFQEGLLLKLTEYIQLHMESHDL